MKKIILLFILSIGFGIINAKEATFTKKEPLSNTTEMNVVFRTTVKVINRDIDERIYLYTNGTFKIIPSNGIAITGTYTIEDGTNLLIKPDNGAPAMYLTITYYRGKVTSIKYRDIRYLPF